MKVLQYPHPYLRNKCIKVKSFNESLRTLSKEMYKTMVDQGGIGLSGAQVGSELDIIVCEDSQNNRTLFMCNAEIISRSGEQVGIEGCLSFPDMWKEVTRANKIAVKFQDLNGSRKTLVLEGLISRVVQHEIDHNKGILFIDYE